LGGKREGAHPLNTELHSRHTDSGGDQVCELLQRKVDQPWLAGSPFSRVAPALRQPVGGKDPSGIGVGDEIEDIALAVCCDNRRERRVEQDVVKFGEVITTDHADPQRIPHDAVRSVGADNEVGLHLLGEARFTVQHHGM
jgi:hypothetical protein